MGDPVLDALRYGMTCRDHDEGGIRDLAPKLPQACGKLEILESHTQFKAVHDPQPKPDARKIFREFTQDGSHLQGDHGVNAQPFIKAAFTVGAAEKPERRKMVRREANLVRSFPGRMEKRVRDLDRFQGLSKLEGHGKGWDRDVLQALRVDKKAGRGGEMEIALCLGLEGCRFQGVGVNIQPSPSSKRNLNPVHAAPCAEIREQVAEGDDIPHIVVWADHVQDPVKPVRMPGQPLLINT